VVLAGGGAAAVSITSADPLPSSPDTALAADLADSIVDTTPRSDSMRPALRRVQSVSRSAERHPAEVGVDKLVEKAAAEPRAARPVRQAGAEASKGKPVKESVSRSAERDAAKVRLDRLVEQAAATASRGIKAPREVPAKPSTKPERVDSSKWVLPTSQYTLTARFGESSGLWSTTHTGLDFAAPEGARLVAVSGGTITSTSYAGAYGNRTVLKLDNGTRVWYCHQASFAAHEGQTVRPGDLIGYVGSTGNSTGAHLHLEVRPRPGHAVDPYQALASHGVRP
jgi:murein DD-endopeptidase MepM/ murein hydrolase activator NlpD